MDRECYKCVYYTNTCTKWSCQFETLEEHDKQIRAEVIEEFVNQIEKQTTFYCGKDSNLRRIAEQLKEQK